MNMAPEPTREQLIAAAVELGGMLAKHPGDFYDVVGGLAAGYSSGQTTEATPKGRVLQVEIGALNELSSVAHSVIEWRVEDARSEYVSWSDIGDALDMTKQAAQQRFGKK